MTAKGRLSHSTSRKTRNSVGWIVGWKISEKLSPDSSDRWVDSSYRPLGYEDRGKLQTQILCDADDNPRRRMNTECQEKRDPYLTQLFSTAKTLRWSKAPIGNNAETVAAAFLRALEPSGISQFAFITRAKRPIC